MDANVIAGTCLQQKEQDEPPFGFNDSFYFTTLLGRFTEGVTCMLGHAETIINIREKKNTNCTLMHLKACVKPIFKKINKLFNN